MKHLLNWVKINNINMGQYWHGVLYETMGIHLNLTFLAFLAFQVQAQPPLIGSSCRVIHVFLPGPFRPAGQSNHSLISTAFMQPIEVLCSCSLLPLNCPVNQRESLNRSKKKSKWTIKLQLIWLIYSKLILFKVLFGCKLWLITLLAWEAVSYMKYNILCSESNTGV